MATTLRRRTRSFTTTRIVLQRSGCIEDIFKKKILKFDINGGSLARFSLRVGLFIFLIIIFYTLVVVVVVPIYTTTTSSFSCRSCSGDIL